MTCTKAEGSRVIEVDGHPYGEYLRSIFGSDTQTQTETEGQSVDFPLRYTFITRLATPWGERRLICSPGQVEEDGSCVFFPADRHAGNHHPTGTNESRRNDGRKS